MQKLFLTLIITAYFFIGQTQNNNSIVVLELFTSQGCSSCPRADELLKEVKHNYPNEVIALSYHVDYWNYIGWKDPFSNKNFTLKQHNYNIKFSSRSNYTPQVVINGKEHFVGSNKKVMSSKLTSYLKKKNTHSISTSNIKKDNNTVAFNYAVSGEISNITLRILLVIEERTTEVKRGENRNRILKNANIVIFEESITLDNKLGNQKITIPSIANEKDNLRLVILTQNKDLDITGGSQIKL